MLGYKYAAVCTKMEEGRGKRKTVNDKFGLHGLIPIYIGPDDDGQTNRQPDRHPGEAPPLILIF